MLHPMTPNMRYQAESILERFTCEKVVFIPQQVIHAWVEPWSPTEVCTSSHWLLYAAMRQSTSYFPTNHIEDLMDHGLQDALQSWDLTEDRQDYDCWQQKHN